MAGIDVEIDKDDRVRVQILRLFPEEALWVDSILWDGISFEEAVCRARTCLPEEQARMTIFASSGEFDVRTAELALRQRSLPGT